MCINCGLRLERECPQCGKAFLNLAKFCDECGQRLDADSIEATGKREKKGERKYVTVLFSDLSGYTMMSEKLDPEEVKEITGLIFAQVAGIIAKYDGFIEKYIGDAVVAIFGIPKLHEDDPLRAIRAAMEIHEIVDKISPKIEVLIGRALSMHSGINTGLVVTGEVDIEKGIHGVAGDTINVAARLQGLAERGNILVAHETYRRTQGYFQFEKLMPTSVKGKSEPIQIYRLLALKDTPKGVYRITGFRADLIGRKSEMTQLHAGIRNLRDGKGSIFSILGEPGTGKSRLLEEFKNGLDYKEFQILEGHAYAYTQTIPYYPLISFFNGLFKIDEATPPQIVREKVQAGIEGLLGETKLIIPFIGNLYSLDYPELFEMSPDLWKFRLHEAVKTILSALARRKPTIFFLEDLHWADSSFLGLLRKLLFEIRYPALIICAYRPPFSLFASHQLSSFSNYYHEIRLEDLSPALAQKMVCSLLKTDSLPLALSQFVQQKAEGNPFYLEEVFNSMIESNALVQDEGKWLLSKSISELDISSSVHGVILARLDRLENESKRILKEASVIGRAFLYKILKMITEIKKDQIDLCLSGLKRLDLIRSRSLYPELEYIFKHVLTQEAIYNSLLKKERQLIHERIGLVIEEVFHDRLPEFFETLAFHFKQGKSAKKAIIYLMKAGSKSHSRCALEEAHQFFKECFEFFHGKTLKTSEEKTLLIDLLIDWGTTFIMRGAYAELHSLFKAHEEVAKSIEDKERLGMFYSILGVAFNNRGHLIESYEYLHKSLELGEQIKSPKLIGHSCYRIAANAALGHLDEAVACGERARSLSKNPKADLQLYKVAFGLCTAYWLRGDIKKLREFGLVLLDIGTEKSDPRHLATGKMTVAYSHFCTGDFESSIKCFKAAIDVALDPLVIQICTIGLGWAYLANGQYKEALSVSDEVISFSDQHGFELVGTLSLAIRGVAMVGSGNLDKGLQLCKKAETIWTNRKNRYCMAGIHLFYGQIYLRIIEGTGPRSFSLMAKNIRSLIKLVFGAARKAEEHFNKSIEISNYIGAQILLAQADLGLGLLYRAKGKKEQAAESISKAIEIFERTEADIYLKKAREAFVSLGAREEA